MAVQHEQHEYVERLQKMLVHPQRAIVLHSNPIRRCVKCSAIKLVKYASILAYKAKARQGSNTTTTIAT